MTKEIDRHPNPTAPLGSRENPITYNLYVKQTSSTGWRFDSAFPVPKISKTTVEKTITYTVKSEESAGFMDRLKELDATETKVLSSPGDENLVVQASYRASRAAAIRPAPGTLVLTLAPYLFSRRTMERVFAQAIADMREEYYGALAERKPVLAWCVRARWCLSVFNTIVLQGGVGIAKKVHAIWKLGGS